MKILFTTEERAMLFTVLCQLVGLKRFGASGKEWYSFRENFSSQLVILDNGRRTTFNEATTQELYDYAVNNYSTINGWDDIVRIYWQNDGIRRERKRQRQLRRQAS